MDKYIEQFDECPTYGVLLIDGEDCVLCEDEERKREPKKPQELIKRDPKRYTKTRRKKRYDS